MVAVVALVVLALIVGEVWGKPPSERGYTWLAVAAVGLSVGIGRFSDGWLLVVAHAVAVVIVGALTVRKIWGPSAREDVREPA